MDHLEPVKHCFGLDKNNAEELAHTKFQTAYRQYHSKLLHMLKEWARERRKNESNPAVLLILDSLGNKLLWLESGLFGRTSMLDSLTLFQPLACLSWLQDAHAIIQHNEEWLYLVG